jgi:hypothetical protein
MVGHLIILLNGVPMKTLILVSLLALSFNTFAKCEFMDENISYDCEDDAKPAPRSEESKCSPDAGVLISQISAKKTCAEASKLAQACALGSSIDVHIAGAAGEVCLKEGGKLSKSDSILLKTMRARCVKAYSNQQGTIYRSINSFCQLSAIEFVVNLLNLENQG